MVEFLLTAAPWVGLGLAAIGLFGIVWSLAPGYRQSRRRCPKCWHDMSGTPDTLRCTECGRTAKSERRLHRRRKRWRLALLSVVVILLGGGAAATPGIRDGSWVRWMPTTVLYAIDARGGGSAQAPRSRTPSTAQLVQEELDARLSPSWRGAYGAPPSFWSGWPKRLEAPMLRSRARGIIANQTNTPAVARAVDCLKFIGLRKSDLPFLRPLLSPSGDAWLRYCAASAVGTLGPDAVPATLDLAEAIAADTDWTAPTAEMIALRNIGPSAAPATEYLRLVLWSPRAGGTYARLPNRVAEDERIIAIDALGAIGLPANSAWRNIATLADEEPHLQPAAVAALVRIAPDEPESLDRAIGILLGPDIGARGCLTDALAAPQCSAIRNDIVRGLIDRLSEPDACVRVRAARGLATLGDIPEALARDLMTDTDPTVRLIVARWASRPESDSSIRHAFRVIGAIDADPLIRTLASRGHEQ